jgi:hypothetical protein
LSTIKEIGDGIKEVVLPLLGILFIMQGSPPTASSLKSIVLKLLPKKKDFHIEYVVNELIENGIIVYSNSEQFLFVVDIDFARNVARDFIEKEDMGRILEIMESIDE